MGYQQQPQESAYGGGASVPLQNPSAPAQTSLPLPAQQVGGNTEPVMPPMPPQYQPPEQMGPPVKAPSYPQTKVQDVPGPTLQQGQKADTSIFDNISKQQVFPGSQGGPGRFSNPYKPTMPMKSSTFEGGGYQGGGYQPPQFEGMRGRLAQYSQYVKKNPFRGQE